jgi:hypothetical protein
MAVGTGCSRQVQVRPAETIASQAEASAAATVRAGGHAEAPHGSRRKAAAGAAVYVDGRAVGTLRYGELPPGIEARAITPNGAARNYRVDEYLRAIGVDVDRARAIHFRGSGQRVSSLEREELDREPGRFVFDFAGNDTGAATIAWDTVGLKNKFLVHEIREVLVYVDRPALAIAPGRSCYLEAGETECSAKVPYATEELAKGTRVYLDGKLAGTVKRRRLTDDLIVGKSDDGLDRFALGKFLASVGVNPARANAIEVVAGDDVVGRGRTAQDVTFVLPRHHSGRVVVAMPTSWQTAGAGPLPLGGGPTQAEVTAVLVYEDKAPSKRALSVPSADPEILDAPPSGRHGEDG